MNKYYKLNLQNFAEDGTSEIISEETTSTNQGIENNQVDQSQTNINNLLNEFNKLKEDNFKLSQTINRLINKKQETPSINEKVEIKPIEVDYNREKLEQLSLELENIKQEKFQTKMNDKIVKMIKDNQIEDNNFTEDVLNKFQKLDKTFLNKLNSEELSDYLEAKFFKDINQYKNIKKELQEAKIEKFNWNEVRSTPVSEYKYKYQKMVQEENPMRKAYEELQKIQKSEQEKDLKRRTSNELILDDNIIE